MDSLTQITLGAACGEVVLGKKIGNRAMLWGALGGYLPDFDIMANFVTDEITALAFHRSITHSLLFGVVAPFGMAWLIHQLYSRGIYKKRAYRAGSTLFWLLFVVGIFNFVPYMVTHDVNYGVLTWTLLIGAIVYLLFWKFYVNNNTGHVNATYKEWYWLFFLSIFTHPLLDSCTAYGTQLFQPFNNYRVALNNVSVVDPIYTLPFLICVIITSMLLRNSPKRRFFNYLGIGLSTAYLLFTFYNKSKVNTVFENSLAEQGFEYSRYMTAPTIFNNVLWHCIAEGDSMYYQGLYSLRDAEPRIAIWNKFPKNHELLKDFEDDRSIKILKWFSKDYYNVIHRKDGKLQLNDLRFGIFGEKAISENDYIFHFILEEKNSKIEAHQSREQPEMEENFKQLWTRIKGLPARTE
jgi:inner membrane protein